MVDLIYETLSSLFAIQQEQPYKRPFVETCKLLREMMPGENEAGASALKLSVLDPRGTGNQGWREPLGSASRPIPSCSLQPGHGIGIVHVSALVRGRA